MRIWMNAPLAVLLLSALCLVINPRPVSAQEVPFEGVITQDDVTLRAGAGTPYYIVGQVGKGVRVTVTERIADWYKITPPAGTFSYVTQAFVDVRGDGGSGTARSRVSVYAASINGPGESYRRQLDLLAGHVVKIVGTDGSFFKIQPPEGSYVYVQTQYVQPAGDAPAPAQPAAPQPAQPEPARPTQPATPEPTPTQPAPSQPVRAEAPAQPEPTRPAQPAPTQATPSEPVTPAPAQPTQPAPSVASLPEPTQPTMPSPAAPEPTMPAQASEATTPSTPAVAQTPSTPAASQPANTSQPAEAPAAEPAVEQPTVVSPNLAAVEQLFIAAQKLPIERQPLDNLRSQYVALENDATLTPGDQRVRSARIAQIDRNIALAKAIAELKDVRQQIRPATTILKSPEPVRGPADYDAVGQLLASSVYDGGTLPRLYRLVTAGEGRTIAYVRPTPSIDAAAALGRTVGIMGETRYDTGLRLRIIDPTRLDVLRASTGE